MMCRRKRGLSTLPGHIIEQGHLSANILSAILVYVGRAPPCLKYSKPLMHACSRSSQKHRMRLPPKDFSCSRRALFYVVAFGQRLQMYQAHTYALGSNLLHHELDASPMVETASHPLSSEEIPEVPSK